ncbi:MAG: FAD-dependent oxidoreductase, partial [Methylocystaceae bacterium]
REAGFDLVEVIGSAGYLISQFLSPRTNLRTDEFGGTLENRMRFGVEVVKEVRRQVGNDFPLSVRFTGHELVPGGTSRDELITFASKLEQAGADLLNVTGGWHESSVPQITMNVPPGAFVYLAQQIKQAVNIPVIASNRINDPLLAEKILLNHQADLISMARGLLADPELPRKAKAGRYKEIRKCIGCNQGCMDHVFDGKIVECLVNAEAGHEFEIDIEAAENKKRILVIGGGPAGMETARVAALRGHDVTLWEKSERLGGQLHLAAAPPGRADFKYLGEYLEASLQVLGVEVHLNKVVDGTCIRDFSPDVLVIATGASPCNLPVPGAGRPNVLQAWHLLAGDIETGSNVVVVGAGAVGCETALSLARIGTIDPETLQFLTVHKVESPDQLYNLSTHGLTKITSVEQQPRIGEDIGRSSKWVISMDLPRFGIQVATATRVIAIDDEGVVIEKGDERSKIKADTIVLAVGSKPNNELYEQLKDVVPEIYLIGDARQPRKVMDAIGDGFHLAIKL